MRASCPELDRDARVGGGLGAGRGLAPQLHNSGA